MHLFKGSFVNSIVNKGKQLEQNPKGYYINFRPNQPTVAHPTSYAYATLSEWQDADHKAMILKLSSASESPIKTQIAGPLPPEFHSEGLVCGLEISNTFPVDATAANLGTYFENLRVKIFQAYLFRNSAINIP